MIDDGAWGDGWDVERGSMVLVDARRWDADGTSQDASRAADDTPLIVSRVVFKENHLGLADERELGDVGLQSISGTK